MKRFRLETWCIIFALGLFACLPPEISRAQWNGNDSVVVSTDGSEIELAMIGDGVGGSFMAWSQWIPGIGWRILAQRSDSAGHLLWTAGGVQVSAASGYQPQLISDGSGGVVVVWRDWGVRAMRLDASGSPVWPSEVEIVSNDDYPTYAPAYTSDGSGGVIVTWDGPDHFTSDRSLFDIRAQRVSASGQFPWGPAPVLVCSAPDYQSDAQTVSDGQGGAILAWRHEGTTPHADVFAQRLDSTGTPLWASGGVPVCRAAGVQEDVALHVDGFGGAIVVWKDGRASTGAIYGQHLDALGQTMWNSDGVRIGGVAGPAIAFRSTSDLAGGAIITWAGESSSTGPRTAQRIDGNGGLLWPPDGVVIVNEDQDPIVAHVAPDGGGGALFAWADRRRGDCVDTYAQNLDATGSHLWDASGVVVAAIERSSLPHAVAAFSTTAALVFWGGPGPAVGLPKQPAVPSGPSTPQAQTSPTVVVLSRVTSTGTGWIADCVPPVAAPPVEARLALAISNHPNPFNPHTVITYATPHDGHARLVVYDVAGGVVRKLLDQWNPAGSHEIVWDGRDDQGRRVPSGVYLSRLTIGEYQATNPMLLLK